jgi:hypothetical protein
MNDDVSHGPMRIRHSKLDGLDGLGRPLDDQETPVVIEIWTGWTGWTGNFHYSRT